MIEKIEACNLHITSRCWALSKASMIEISSTSKSLFKVDVNSMIWLSLIWLQGWFNSQEFNESFLVPQTLLSSLLILLSSLELALIIELRFFTFETEEDITYKNGRLLLGFSPKLKETDLCVWFGQFLEGSETPVLFRYEIKSDRREYTTSTSKSCRGKIKIAL